MAKKRIIGGLVGKASYKINDEKWYDETLLESDDKEIIYPVRLTEYDDDSGHGFRADTPDLPGMLTQGDTIESVTNYAKKAIALYLDGEVKYPAPTHPVTWALKANQSIIFVKVQVEWEPQPNHVVSSFELRRILDQFNYYLYEKQAYFKSTNEWKRPKDALMAENYNEGFEDAYKLLRKKIEHAIND
jgi:predicted RNase H-like HicB family nuclease